MDHISGCRRQPLPRRRRSPRRARPSGVRCRRAHRPAPRHPRRSRQRPLSSRQGTDGASYRGHRARGMPCGTSSSRRCGECTISSGRTETMSTKAHRRQMRMGRRSHRHRARETLRQWCRTNTQIRRARGSHLSQCRHGWSLPRGGAARVRWKMSWMRRFGPRSTIHGLLDRPCAFVVCRVLASFGLVGVCEVASRLMHRGNPGEEVLPSTDIKSSLRCTLPLHIKGKIAPYGGF